MYGIPNDGSEKYLNDQHLRGNIVIVDRGTVPFAIKVQNAQAAGAEAVIIVDNGGCSETLNCGVLGHKGDRGKF